MPRATQIPFHNHATKKIQLSKPCTRKRIKMTNQRQLAGGYELTNRRRPPLSLPHCAWRMRAASFSVLRCAFRLEGLAHRAIMLHVLNNVVSTTGSLHFITRDFHGKDGSVLVYRVLLSIPILSSRF